jgi:hypothetical protein
MLQRRQLTHSTPTTTLAINWINYIILFKCRTLPRQQGQAQAGRIWPREKGPTANMSRYFPTALAAYAHRAEGQHLLAGQTEEHGG